MDGSRYGDTTFNLTRSKAGGEERRLEDMSTMIQMDEKGGNDYSMLMRDVGDIKRYLRAVRRDEEDLRVKEENLKIDLSDYRIDRERKEDLVKDLLVNQLSVEAKKIKLAREMQDAQTTKSLIDRGMEYEEIGRMIGKATRPKDVVDVEQLLFSKYAFLIRQQEVRPQRLGLAPFHGEQAEATWNHNQSSIGRSPQEEGRFSVNGSRVLGESFGLPPQSEGKQTYLSIITVPKNRYHFTGLDMLKHNQERLERTKSKIPIMQTSS